MTDNNYQGYQAYQGYTPLEVATPQPINYNTQNNGYEGRKSHYRTPLSTFHCTACPVGIFAVLLFGTVFVILLLQGETSGAIFGFIFITVWGIGFIGASGLGILCISIDIDPYVKEIVIKNIKMCFCFNKKKVFAFDNVQKIIISRDTSHAYVINGVHYYSFKMEILLSNNEVIDVFGGVIDKDNESQKVYGIFRESLPSNIIVEININN